MIASLVIACEAISHANDYSTASAQIDNCAEGTILCNGNCQPEDGKNCGACGVTCEASQVCSAGVCGSQCSGGTTQCAGTDSQVVCVDTQNDPANCGRCGGFPDAGTCPICQNGSCTNDCAAPSKLCKGRCVEFDNDPKNCGGCGVQFQCADGQFCSAGKCGISCGSLTECGGACVDPSSDVDHCDPTGGCGVQCTIAPNTFHGAPVCVSGLCGIACEIGFTSCETINGRECICGNCPLATGGNGGTTCPKGDTCANSQCIGTGH